MQYASRTLLSNYPDHRVICCTYQHDNHCLRLLLDDGGDNRYDAVHHLLYSVAVIVGSNLHYNHLSQNNCYCLIISANNNTRPSNRHGGTLN